MKIKAVFVCMCLAGAAARADTNILTTEGWIVDGAEDPAPNAWSTHVLVDGTPVGDFSELKVYYILDGAAVQVYSIKGRGVVRPSLPPPGEPGAAFELTGYWDCDAGYIGSLAITELNFRSKGGRKSPLKVRGKLSNFDSLASDDLNLKFFPAKSDALILDWKFRLEATRDICVDRQREEPQDWFHIARMVSNFVSTNQHLSNRVRYIKRDGETCTGLGDCSVDKSSVCADLANANGYLFNRPRSLAKPALVLLHTRQTPRNTPTLGIEFRSPPKGKVRPQGFLTPTDDETAENVTVWGNWRAAKPQYKAGKSLGRFRFRFGARDPFSPGCDSLH